ncbi:hypothetical protein CFP56_042809 [Quercus suber]|uniref:Uncharacterized protein n=1 Tax=Quercus suber TaxID=58331 RepID=A0AAW0ISE9_QUESU
MFSPFYTLCIFTYGLIISNMAIEYLFTMVKDKALVVRYLNLPTIGTFLDFGEERYIRKMRNE